MEKKNKSGRPKINKYSTDTKMSLSLPKEIHKELKLESVKRERPMSEIVIDAIKKYLNI